MATHSLKNFSMRGFLILALSLGVYADYTVPVEKINIWGNSKNRKMKGVCTLEIQQKKQTGEISVDMVLDRKTFGIEIWNMNVDNTLDNGKIYEMSSKYEFHPRTLRVEFILTYKGGKKKFPKGVCITNLPEPITTTAQPPTTSTTTTSTPAPSTSEAVTSTTTTVPTTAAPSTSVGVVTTTQTANQQSNGNIVPIFVESSWKDDVTPDMKMTGVCKFNISKAMPRFYIRVDVDKDTYGLVTWIVNETDSDPSGRWYITKNNWPEYPQEINFRFHLHYYSDPPPAGLCQLDTKLPQPPTPPPTTTEVVNTGNTVPIFVESSWDDHESDDKKMTGVCKFNISKKTPKFRIRIDVDKQTYGLDTWIVKETDSDVQGYWYDTQNIWPEYPPEINFRFHLYFYSNPPPTGTCTLDTSPQPPNPKTTPAATTATTAPTTASPSTPVPSSTAQPTTASPPTAAPSTAAPTTGSPTTTAAPTTGFPTTDQPSTAAPSTASPSTAVPSTAAQTTASPSSAQPSTAAPTTASPPTAAPTTQAATSTQSPTTSSPIVNIDTKYDYGELLHKSILFYEAQRSGKLPANNRVDWRGDSALGDSGLNGEDLTGGWYDAGDGVKFNFPMASATTVLSLGLLMWSDGYQQAGELDNMYDSIKWPLDYFLKCWREDDSVYYAQVGNGEKDHAYWGRMDEMSMARPAYKVDANSGGSDVAGETAAAMAAGAMAFQSRDPAYANELLRKAESLYAFAKTYRKKYSDTIPDAAKFYNSYSGYDDELCESAVILHMATGDQSYLNDAEAIAPNKVAWAMSWDDKTPLCQVLLYQVTGKNIYKSNVEKFIASYMPGGNVQQSPCGLAWRAQWGSLRYSANAALIALIAADSGFAKAEDYKKWAMSQIHYMVGDNSDKFSYVVGFGDKYPQQPHHRASSCPDRPMPCSWDDFNSPAPNPQILEGALVGGPDGNDFYQDKRNDYIKNEVTCDYNAGFQSAVAGLLDLAVREELPSAPKLPCA